MKLVDAGDSKSPAARRAGSIPASGTTLCSYEQRHTLRAGSPEALLQKQVNLLGSIPASGTHFIRMNSVILCELARFKPCDKACSYAGFYSGLNELQRLKFDLTELDRVGHIFIPLPHLLRNFVATFKFSFVTVALPVTNVVA